MEVNRPETWTWESCALGWGGAPGHLLASELTGAKRTALVLRKGRRKDRAHEEPWVSVDLFQNSPTRYSSSRERDKVLLSRNRSLQLFLGNLRWPGAWIPVEDVRAGEPRTSMMQTLHLGHRIGQSPLHRPRVVASRRTRSRGLVSGGRAAGGRYEALPAQALRGATDVYCLNGVREGTSSLR